MTSVLITRPAEQARHLAAVLNDRGYVPFVEPLLTIEATDKPRPLDDGISAIMITSQNALRVLMDRQEEINDWLSLPCVCVGAKTARAARDFGFLRVNSAESNGLALAHVVMNKLKLGRGKDVGGAEKILHISGEHVASPGRDLLQESGFDVLVWPVYQAKSTPVFSGSLQQALVSNTLNAALFFSPRTAAEYVRLTRHHNLEACCKSLTAIGLSEAVGKALQKLAWQRVEVAEAPTEASILACLELHCPVT